MLIALSFGLGCAEYIASPEEPTRDVRAIQLNMRQLTLDEGETAQLLATVLDQVGQPFTQLPSGITMRWTSSDDAIATIDGSGLVSGRREGGATVAAEASGRFGSVSVSAGVTVRPQVTALELVAGDDQTGTVGEAAAQRLQAKVSNRLGAGVPGVRVDFTVALGGGTLDAPSALTDVNGVAEVGWTLGTTAGANIVEARTARLPLAVVRYNALGRPGAVTTIARVSGDAQTAGTGTALPQPLVASVVDRYGNAVAQVNVDWNVTSGGGSITPATVPSDANGQASAQWTLGSADGAQNATASVAGALLVGFGATAVAPVASVTVEPPTPSVVEGGTVSFAATVRDAGGNVLQGRTVTWSTSDQAIATITSAGVLSALVPGPVTVTATVDGVAGTASVTVTPAPVATVTVAPAAASLIVGGTQPFTATPKDAAGRTLTGRTVAWSVSNDALATIDASGLLTAVAGGALTVTATVEGINGTASVTITALPAPVASVEITPPNPTLVSGTTQQFTATPKDAAGNVLSGRTVSEWSSTATGVASVDANGLVQATLVGSATIAAVIEGVSGSTTVVVTPGATSPATSLVSVSSSTVPVTGFATLTLQVRDAAGNGTGAGGLTVVFTATGGTSVGAIGATQDHGDGTYSAIFTGVTAGSPVSIGATINGTPVSTTLPTIEVTGGTPGTRALNWINPAGGVWNNPANWDQGRVPTPEDTAHIDMLAVTVTTTGSIQVGGLVMGPRSSTLRLDDATLAVGGAIHIENDALIDMNFGEIRAAILENRGNLHLASTAVRVPVLLNAAGELQARAGGSSPSQIEGNLDNEGGTVTVLGINERAAQLDVSGNLRNNNHVVLSSELDFSNAALNVVGAFTNTTRGRVDAYAGLGGPRTITAGRVTNAGRFSTALDPGSPLIIQVTTAEGFTNESGGSIIVEGGLTAVSFTVPGAALINQSGGSVQIGPNTVLQVSGGDFRNAGTVIGGVVGVTGGVFRNDGAILPGGRAQYGIFGVVGDAVFGSASALELEANGPLQDTEYDAVVVSGAATLGGELVFLLLDGYMPASGDSFILLGYTSSTGTITTTLPSLTPPLDWNIDQTPVGITVTAGGANPPTIAASDGDGQNVIAGQLVPVPPTVVVRDGDGNAIQGVSITFAVGLGGGSITGADQVTNSDGFATVGSWRVGSTAGLNTLTATASVPGISGNPVTFTALALVPNPGSVTLSLGQGFSCRINSGAVTQCWGTNTVGQLGDFSNTDRSLPVTVFGGIQFVAITAGLTHTCGLTAAGVAYCWGDNSHGEFGDITWENGASPRLAAKGMIFDQITAGAHYTCGIQPGGAAYCWGNNGRGNLGDGTTDPHNEPTPVAGGLSFTSISAGGDNHTCALTAAGQAYCWGYNFDGELGDGTFTDRLTPVPVAGGHTFSQLKSSYFHTCGLTTTGAAYCWGDNNVRQLGDGSSADQPTPQPVVGGHTFTQLAENAYCALEANGSAWCWGFNPSGQLGDGTTNTALAPVAVAGGHSFVTIAGAADGGHTCARTAAGNTWCWGGGGSGQLGDGTLSNHLTPIEVGVLPPTQLAFIVQPVGARAGVTMPSVVVAVQDATGATVTSSHEVITLELASNPTDANLGGTLTVEAVNGLATFSNLSVDLPGTGYTLRAFSEVLPEAISQPFTITPPRITLDIAGSDVVGVGSAVALGITLDRPAPVGGVTVTLSSDNPANVSVDPPGTVFIAAGTSTGQINVNGVNVGGTTIRASAPGYENAALFVQTTNQIISLPTTLNVPYGQTVTIPVQLGVPAPPGGLDVTLVSSDPSRVQIVTPTVHLNAGLQLGSGQVFGALPGPATVTATAPSWATDVSTVTTTANLNIVASSLTLNATFGIGSTVELQSNGAGVAAPSPGITVTLTPTNPACAAVTSPLTIPTGQVNVPFTVTYGGTATLPCSTTITASATNIVSDVVTVTVQPAPSITVGAPPRVGRGLQTTQSLFLGASNYGTTTVHIESANPSVLLVSPADSVPGAAAIDIVMTAPTTNRNFYIQGVEGAAVPTNVTITFSAPGFNGTSQIVPIVQGAVGLAGPSPNFTSLTPNQDFQVRIGAINATGNGIGGEQFIRAGGVPVDVTVENTAAAVAQLVTRDSSRQIISTRVPIRNSRSPNFVNGGVQFQPLNAGQTKVKPSAAGFVAVESVTVNVTAPALTGSAGTRVGRGLQTSSTVFMGATDYDTATIHIESDNPAKILVSPAANVAGTASIDLAMTAPTSNRTFYVQGVQSADTTTDSVRIFFSASRFVPDTVKWILVQSAVGMAGPAATTTSLSVNSPFTVRIGAINTTKNGIVQEQVIRAGGDSLEVIVANRNAVAAQLVTRDSSAQTVSTVIRVGASRSASTLAQRSVEFDPLEAGTTRVVPSLTTFATVESTTVTITAPVISLSTGSRVGRGLQTSANVFLSATDYGTATVHLESADPTRLLLAPDATTPGTASLDLVMTEPLTNRTFYLAGVESADTTTDTVLVSASTPRFTSAAVKWAVVQGAVGLAGPSATTTTLSPNNDFQVRIGAINTTKNGIVAEQPIRAAGTPVDVTVTNSNAVVGQLVTRDSTRQIVSTRVAIGQTRSPSFVNGGVQFEPLSTGTTRVKPALTNFKTVDSVTVTVGTPAITLSAGPRLGSGLQTSSSLFLGANAYGTVTVHIVSSDPTKVLVAPNATTAGTASIDIVMNAPTTNATYYLQGVEGVTIPATITVTASAPGFTDGTQSVTVAPSAVGLVGPSTNQNASGPNVDFQVRIGVVNTTGNGIAAEQTIRAGGTAVTATVTNSNASAAQLVTNATTGQSVTTPLVIGDSRSHTFANGGLRFDPLAAGQTTIAASIPGFVAVDPVTVNVTGTASSVSAGGSGSGLPAARRQP